MTTINRKLYTLMFATSALLPTGTLVAEDKSQWECTPSADFRSWVCLKDGKPPVEPQPEPVAEKAAQPSGVTITPLAQPASPAEPQPVPQPSPEIVQPADAPAPPTLPAEQAPVEITAEEPTPAAPTTEVVAETPEPVAPTPAEAEVAGEQEPQPVTEAPDTEIAAETPAPGPQDRAGVAETEDEPPAEPVAELAGQETTADEIAAGITPLDSQLVRVDESLRSCVAVNPPLDTKGQDLAQVRQTSPTQIEADDAYIEKEGKTILTGNVSINRADQTLKSQEVLLDKATNQIDVSGDVDYTDNQIHITSTQAHLDLDKDEHNFSDANFITLQRYSRGKAGHIQAEQGERLNMDQVTYTTCPPDNTSWQLTADEITLDDVSGRGEARNVKFEFFDIPVMYLPYMNFPIDDRRKSGLLTPRFGHSDKRGTELTLPVYWNIAPDQDATFYPRYMSKRGLQLGAEYRRLNEDNYVSQANFEYLHDDDKYNDDRWGVKLEHTDRLPRNWFMRANLRRVSDDQYFEDLGSSLALTSTTHLDSHLLLRKSSHNWNVRGFIQNYQTVDSTISEFNTPYERMPQLNFNYWTDPFAGNFTADVKTSFTHFDHNSNLRVTSKRSSVYPSITYNFDQPGYYIRPKLGVHYTHYDLDNEGTLSSSQSRTVPIFSLDSGLFYEKETTLFGNSMTQTLEPRFYYLNVKEENQNTIPVFDTGELDFGSSALFRENRYNGIDRIGDANQLSAAVTTRFIDSDDGSEKISATLGQIYYFSDRDVTLPGEAKDTDDVSPIVAELTYRPTSELIGSAQYHWDPEESKTERQLYRVKYQPEDDKILNMSYRFRDKYLKQTDVSFLWPLDKRRRWHALGRWNYSLRDDKTLDTFGGVEYESCCWKTRFVARRWVNDVNSDYDTGVFFEIEFKGLGSVGNDVTSFLETGILGYDRHIDEEDDDTNYY